MKVAVRYYSKLGNTKKIAEAIAEGVGVDAVSVLDETELKEYVDILFLGGAPYANIMAPQLKSYARQITADKVGRVVLFSTSNWSKRTVKALKKMLTEKGILVEKDYFYAQMFRVKARTQSAKEFAKKMVK